MIGINPDVGDFLPRFFRKKIGERTARALTVPIEATGLYEGFSGVMGESEVMV